MRDKSARIMVEPDPDLMEIIPFFMECRRRELRAMREALAREDMVAIRWLAHNLKGAGGSFGFDIASEIGEALEKSAARGDLNEIEGKLNELTEYFNRVEVVGD